MLASGPIRDHTRGCFPQLRTLANPDHGNADDGSQGGEKVGREDEGQ